VPVRYSPLAHDNPLGRLLKALCITLRNRAVSQAARRDLDLCIDLLGGVRTEPLTTQLVRRVALGRFETEWRPLIELAALIAQGMSPDPANLGGTRQDTLLFPLERLFELVIRRSLTERLMPPLTCAASPGKHGLLSLTTPAGRETALALRPDLLFRRSESVVAAGDAKWKRLEQCPPRFTILPADVYQILAYMRLFSVRTGLLFFPRASWMPEDWTCQFTVAPDEAERITVLAVDLARLADPLPDRRAAHADALARRVQAALETEPDAAVEELRPPAPLHA
jgi:5-methylcytosine-specific restriction endonuclease McrBC regulatory subunit McrC